MCGPLSGLTVLLAELIYGSHLWPTSCFVFGQLFILLKVFTPCFFFGFLLGNELDLLLFLLRQIAQLYQQNLLLFSLLILPSEIFDRTNCSLERAAWHFSKGPCSLWTQNIQTSNQWSSGTKILSEWEFEEAYQWIGKWELPCQWQWCACRFLGPIASDALLVWLVVFPEPSFVLSYRSRYLQF